MHIERRKIWVNNKDLENATKVINNLIEVNPNNPTLQGLHDEIAVARVRFKEGVYKSTKILSALGKNKNDVPLNLSVEEISLLATSPLTTDSLRHTLEDIL